MGVISKKVLIVDDYEKTEEIKIDNYKEIFEVLKNTTEDSCNFNLDFIWEKTIEGAINRLNTKLEVFDVMLIDYNFNNDERSRKGVELVKEIRKTINKRCKIIFYTMDGYEGIDKKEYVELINNDVFRFFSKSGEILGTSTSEYEFASADTEIVKGIIEAIKETDPIINALESFLTDYYEILKDTKIDIKGEEFNLQQLIDSIRLDTEPGITFVEKLFRMSILDYLNTIE